MHLMHNQLYRLTTDTHGLAAGTYRVMVDDGTAKAVYCALIEPAVPPSKGKGGRPRIEDLKLKRKKRFAQAPRVGALYRIERHDFLDLIESLDLVALSLKKLPGSYYEPIERASALLDFQRRCRIMEPFFDQEKLKESLQIHGNLASMKRAAALEHEVSENYVDKLWSILCYFGLEQRSLRTRKDRCGAPGEKRDLSEDKTRKKAGRKTSGQRLNKLICGCWGDAVQPGMSIDWRARIIHADNSISTPKPSMRSRYERIIAIKFATEMTFDENGRIVAVELKKGQYPNFQQVKRVLTKDTSDIERIREKTSQGHFKRSLRGLSGCSWQGAEGPGMMFAIDSTIGDVYLRSSIDPTWIIGRPITYIIVDVFSTAVVGFYVCLTGPSWATAAVSIFNTTASSSLLSDLWGYDMRQSLFPAPTLPASLLCDRGEYLSKSAKATGMKLRTTLRYTPPFRPDLKGVVEVMHRIAKDAQYQFLPGAMDARRAEYELRRSNPAAATMTVRQYMQYLHEVFYIYNLTADRAHRLDAHMVADGVYPSPGGLWTWGHKVGIGFMRAQPQAELIASLLPQRHARVTANGVKFLKSLYQSPIVDSEQWTTLARSKGGWELPAYYYPGSVSRIWTPHSRGDEFIDLAISDYSRASSELTYDEVADAFAFQKLKAADIEHQNLQEKVLGLKRMQAIRANAEAEVRAASDSSTGLLPNISEARALEVELAGRLGVGEIRGSKELRSEAMDAHHQMMNELYATMDAGEGNA
ncbi:integrase family protein [Acidovorax sp. CF316]|uniref:DDE-type integrase/transposase/recombinase n=1 Tax=Acidovorax sp. CF316 TaxID=1144317 RepID=UPI00026BD2D7|nr:DDE-type integrase/transposase/recombinase [Acidovorax sp. CF316]EJE54418.1 integrase family protein [Acidovorax sp. CF316]